MARLTIPDEDTFAEFTVTTSTTVFPVSFSLFAKADLTVYVGGVALGQADFSFSGSILEGGGYSGGTVTLNTAVDDVTVRIERNVSLERTSNFAPAGTTPTGTIDQAFNRVVAQQQDLQRRALTARDGAEAASDLAQQYAADAAQVSGVNVPIYASVASAAGSTIDSGVKSIRVQFRAPSYAVPATLVGGADYSVVSEATVADYPASAYFESADGRFWLIDTTDLSVMQFGALGDDDNDDEQAINDAILTAVAAGCGRVRAPRGTYCVSAQIDTPANVELEMAQGAVIKATGDFDVVRLHAKGRFKGKVDGSGVVGFSSALLLIDGADEASAATAFRLHTNTSFDFEGVLSAVATTGAHIHFKATTTNARIMGVQGRAKMYGGEYGIKETISATDGSNFITGVDIVYEASECRRVIHQDFGSGGMYHIDAHRWWGSAQPRTGTTVPMYNVGGQYSTYCFIPWDWQEVAGTAPYGVVIQAGARRSRMTLVLEDAYLNVVTTDKTFVVENLYTGLTSSINTSLIRGPTDSGNLVDDVPNGTGLRIFRINGANAVIINAQRHVELYGSTSFPAVLRNTNLTATRNYDLLNVAGSIPIVTAVPASATAAGVAGQIAFNATHAYFCIATDTWVRAALATW